MKMPSSVGSQGFPAWPLAPPRMLMPSLSPGAFWMQSSRMPGGGGSLRTSSTSSRQGRSRALTASWCVASRTSCPFTARMRSPTRRPLRAARPRGSTCGGRAVCRGQGAGPPCTLRRPRGLLYLRNEHARLLDTEWVAGVVGAPNDAEPQGAPSSGQTDLLGTWRNRKRGWNKLNIRGSLPKTSRRVRPGSSTTGRPCEGAEKTAGGGSPYRMRPCVLEPERTGHRPLFSHQCGQHPTPRAARLWRRGLASGQGQGCGLTSTGYGPSRAAASKPGDSLRGPGSPGAAVGGGEEWGRGLGARGPPASRSSNRAMVGEAAVSRETAWSCLASVMSTPLICKSAASQKAPGRGVHGCWAGPPPHSQKGRGRRLAGCLPGGRRPPQRCGR